MSAVLSLFVLEAKPSMCVRWRGHDNLPRRLFTPFRLIAEALRRSALDGPVAQGPVGLAGPYKADLRPELA
jgi:hypothetical protein